MARRTPRTPSQDKHSVPIFVRREVDELKISLEAFRVYAHLARRAGQANEAWPSYQSIGEACFRATNPKAQSASLRRKAIRAVQELDRAGVISVERRRVAGKLENRSNMYRIVPLTEWPKRPPVEERK